MDGDGLASRRWTGLCPVHAADTLALRVRAFVHRRSVVGLGQINAAWPPDVFQAEAGKLLLPAERRYKTYCGRSVGLVYLGANPTARLPARLVSDSGGRSPERKVIFQLQGGQIEDCSGTDRHLHR